MSKMSSLFALFCINSSLSPLIPVKVEKLIDWLLFKTSHLIIQLDTFPSFWKAGEWSSLKTFISTITLTLVL